MEFQLQVLTRIFRAHSLMINFIGGCDMGEFWSSTIIDKNQNILSKKPFWFFVLNSYPQFLFIATPIL